jgi:hypothetical protein
MINILIKQNHIKVNKINKIKQITLEIERLIIKQNIHE